MDGILKVRWNPDDAMTRFDSPSGFKGSVAPVSRCTGGALQSQRRDDRHGQLVEGREMEFQHVVTVLTISGNEKIES